MAAIRKLKRYKAEIGNGATNHGMARGGSGRGSADKRRQREKIKAVKLAAVAMPRISAEAELK